jgi:hypothetical protein
VLPKLGGVLGAGAVLLKAMNGDSSISISNDRSVSVPSGKNLNYSSMLSKTSSGTLTSNTLVRYEYTIEGYDLEKLMTQEWSVLFYVKSSVASKRSFAIRNATESHSLVKQYEINAANTWELKVLKLPALNSFPGTLNRTNGVGIFCTFSIVAGSNLRTSTLDVAVAGAYAAGNGEDSTWLTGTNHDFSLTGIMIIPGDWTAIQSNPAAYEFVRAGRNFQEELMMSQRYYEEGYIKYVSALASGSQGIGGSCNYRVIKRANPTVIAYKDDSKADINAARNNNDGSTLGSVSVGANTAGFGANAPSASSNVSYGGFWTADARF